MPPGQPSREEHLYWLDWIRFLAAAIVVYGHIGGFAFHAWPGREAIARTAATEIFLSSREMGRQAVVVFFVLSGLLVGGKVVARVRAGTFDLASYATDRIARVYVPLVPAVLLTIVLLPFSDQPAYPWPYLRCLTGTQELFAHTGPFNAPLWTLAYEIWFYVLAGCAALVFSPGYSRRARSVGVAGTAVALWIFWQMESAYLACWLLGAGGFWLRGRLRGWRAGWASSGVAIVAVGTWIYQVDLGIVPGPGGVWLPPPPVAQIVVAGGALLTVAALMAATPGSRLAELFERIGTSLAAGSYTLYLTHYPLVYLLAFRIGRLPPVLDRMAVGRMALWGTVCALVAWAMYVAFESRTGVVKKKMKAG